MMENDLLLPSEAEIVGIIQGNRHMPVLLDASKQLIGCAAGTPSRIQSRDECGLRCKERVATFNGSPDILRAIVIIPSMVERRRVVVVTGSGGTGCGRAIALRFAGDG